MNFSQKPAVSIRVYNPPWWWEEEVSSDTPGCFSHITRCQTPEDSTV